MTKKELEINISMSILEILELLNLFFDFLERILKNDIISKLAISIPIIIACVFEGYHFFKKLIAIKKEGSNEKWDKKIKCNFILFIIPLIYILVSFIPKPIAWENWNSLVIRNTESVHSSPTVVPTEVPNSKTAQTAKPTDWPTHTTTPTPTNTSTITPTPTITPTIIPTHVNYPIKMCVFDLGIDENNEPIAKPNIEYLQTLGFNVKNVYINNKSSYEDCDVLYLSDGWVTIKDELQIVENMDNLKKKLEEPNAPGLLIGNPGKDYTPFHIDFYAPINYCKISSERVGELFPSDIRKNNAIKYSFLSDFIPTDDKKLDEEIRKELPVPESVASIEQDYDKPFSFQYLVVCNQLKDITVKNQCDNHTVIGGLIASNESQNNPRYIIMPGGEFSSRYPISDDLFVLIIKWLAGISIK